LLLALGATAFAIWASFPDTIKTSVITRIVRGRPKGNPATQSLNASVPSTQEAVTTQAQELERLVKEDPRVKRLLKISDWWPVAEAAIGCFVHGKDCKIESYRKRDTWAQVKAVVEELARKGTSDS